MTETERVPHPLENPETDEVTGREVAEALGVTRATFSRWKRRFDLEPVRRKGNQFFYSRTQIMGILAERESQ